MYLRISTDTPDDELSWLLSKRPGSAFERSIGNDEGKRTVRGRFADDGAYEVIVHNDAGAILDELRAENRASYVSAKPYAVLPYNLRGVRVCLASALAGKAELPPDRVALPRALHATVGPFLAPLSRVAHIYAALGFAVAWDDGGMGVTLSATMPFGEFLPRLYVGALYLSIGDHDHKNLDDSAIRAVMTASAGWLAACPIGESIIRRLAGKREGMAAEFRETAGMAPSEAPERGASLHAQRHALILASVPETARTIVDLGCGDGKLTAALAARFPEARILAVDAVGQRLHRATRGLRNVTAMHANAIAPYLEAEHLTPDALVLSEVIEHMESYDRALLVDQIARMWRPAFLAITTPNREANESIGVPAGEMRHADHRVEYDRGAWEREVVSPLRHIYALTEHTLDVPDGAPQPSFILTGVRTGQGQQPSLLREARAMHAPYVLDDLGMEVSESDMVAGLTHEAYTRRRGLFYCAPTMAPVDYLGGPALEHPTAAFKYFRDRGVQVLVEQEKVMGSRCTLMLFRDLNAARGGGFERRIVALTRGGRDFFDDTSFLDPAADVAFSRTDADVIILDAEVTPWVLKAGGLIASQFEKPMRAARAWRAFAGESTDSADAFLAALANYSVDGPTTVHAFGLLATAKIARRGFRDMTLWAQKWQTEQACELDDLFTGTAVRVVPTRTVNTYSVTDMDASVARWEAFTAAGGEGFAYKPNDPRQTMPDGGPIQAALKVRGVEYLRLVYGDRYTDAENFARLAHRGTKRKRRLALAENALALRVLRAFLSGQTFAHDRVVAAFLGVDQVEGGAVDATL